MNWVFIFSMLCVVDFGLWLIIMFLFALYVLVSGCSNPCMKYATHLPSNFQSCHCDALTICWLQLSIFWRKWRRWLVHSYEVWTRSKSWLQTPTSTTCRRTWRSGVALQTTLCLHWPKVVHPFGQTGKDVAFVFRLSLLWIFTYVWVIFVWLFCLFVFVVYVCVFVCLFGWLVGWLFVCLCVGWFGLFVHSFVCSFCLFVLQFCIFFIFMLLNKFIPGGGELMLLHGFPTTLWAAQCLNMTPYNIANLRTLVSNYVILFCWFFYCLLHKIQI